MEERARRLLLGQREELPAHFYGGCTQRSSGSLHRVVCAQAYWDRGALDRAESRFAQLVEEAGEAQHLFALESLVDLLRRKGDLVRAEELAESLLIPSTHIARLGMLPQGRRR